MGAILRTVVYATLFVGLVLVFVPAQILSWSGTGEWPPIGVREIIAMTLAGLGGALALWCAFTFASLGKGTPAPFDPPRRLVVRGPYRFVRNPMYIGAGLAVAGAALFYQSIPLLVYVGILSVITNLFVVRYEEPTLRRMFGPEYEDYCARVGRWWPTR